MYDCPETERAARLHRKWCERTGHIPDEPAATLSQRTGDVVTLANCKGTLGRYRVGETGRLRRLGLD